MGDIAKFSASINPNTLEYINDDFSKAECKVMYTGANRNNSFISKETVDNNLNTIFNVPVVAEVLYKEDDEDKDFGTHGGRLIMDSNGIRYEETTIPYGVVPESANPRWVEDGEKEYLVCDVLLWTGRYEDLDILLDDDNKSRPQSMEIKIGSSFVDDDGYEVIEDFNFSALTILGSDVEPCFEDARVQMYELDEFKALYNEMLEKYKMFTKGGESLDKEKDVVVTEEDFEKDDELKNDEIDENKKEEEFELSYRDKMEILFKALPEKVDTEEMYKSYYILDFTDTYVDYEIDIYSNQGYENELYRANYTINENNEAIIDFENQEELVRTLITKSEKEELENSRQMALDKLNDKIETLNADLEEFMTENENLKTEKSELEDKLEKEKEFRLEIEKQERIEKVDKMLDSFEKLLSNNPEFSALKDRAYDLELDELEKQCYIIVGKDSFEKSGSKTKNEKKAYTQKNYTIDDNLEDNEEDIVIKIKKDYTK